MGMPIVKVAAGGLPVTIATTGGLPCTEATNGYGIAVTEATGGGGLAVTGFTFGPTIALSASSVLETAAVNTTVGTLSVSGSYTGTPVFTLSDSAGGKFNISGNLLRTNALLDYETATFHNVTVAVSGTTPATASRVITIFVTDVAEPVIALTGTTVNENAAVGVNIGTLSIANAFTGSPVYSLVDSASGKVAISGALLNVGGAIDFETTPTFNITVSVSGITPAAANKVFTVVVNDVVESGTPDSAAYTNFIARTSGLDANHLAAYKNLLDGLTTDGFFDASGNSTLLDALWVMATQDEATSRLNLVANRNNQIDDATGPSNFTPDLGIAGDGTGFRNTNLNSFSAGLNATNSSLSFGLWNNAVGVGAGSEMMTASTATQCIYPCFTGNTTYYRSNGDVTAANTVAAGWYASNRSGTALVGYKNGVSVTTGSSATAPLANGFWYVGGSADPILASYVGVSLNGTQHANLYARLNTYLAEILTGGAEGSGGAGVTKNIVSDYGAVADGQWAKTTLTVSGTTLTSSASLWVAGDVGKSIVVPSIDGFGFPHFTTIAARVSGTQVTLALTAPFSYTAVADKIVAWGTNNEASFQAFKTAYQGQTVTLTIPAGIYLMCTTAAGNFGGLFDGIRNITCNATGATLCGGMFQVQAAAQYQTAGHSAYTASVTAGASYVTLSTPSDVSKFVIGNYAMMTGTDVQHGGYPTNNDLFEYLRITAIDSDSGSPTYGRITFQTPLVKSYLSTWPRYVDENLSGGTTERYGGPATLYAQDPKFNHISVVNGLTIAQDYQYGVSGLDLTFNNCVFQGTGQLGPHPTMARSITFNNCTGLGLIMELDKLVTNLTITGCSWATFIMQSTAIDLLTIDSTTLVSFVGSARKTIVRNGCNFGAWTPGPGFFGYSPELVVSNSIISSFGTGGGAPTKGATAADNGLHVDLTMAGGVMTVPSSMRLTGPGEWAIPGGVALFVDTLVGTLGAFTITNVTEASPGGGNVSVHTNWSKASGGFPPRTYNPANGLFLYRHPATSCTFTSVTGCAEVVDLSNAGAAGLPMNSYTKRTYTGSAASGTYVQMWGRIKKIVVIVTTLGVGTATLSFNNNNGIKASDGTTTTNWGPVIDLSKTGTRTFDATAGSYPVTWSSTAVGATDTLPGQTEALWCGANFVVFITAGTAAVFSVEMITEQGF